ncbi:peptidase domain-containing ABC transporter [Ralstonia pseudosolanacearum]|uniref:peptidase domain-containing ABC transporter n=1 Tax=Ralstonia pseudosolanacearum TaxID=1310165 RepID=UPI004053931A
MSSGLNFGGRRGLPVILQSETAECGLACLAMVSGYYGHHISMPLMRGRYSVSLKGTNLAQLMEIAQSLGLQARPLQLEVADLERLATPCILHWNLNHFVVLKSVRRNHVIIHDPAVGARKVSKEDLANRFTGIALELSKGPAFQRKAAEPPLSLRGLAGSISGLGRALVQILGMALVLELFVVLTPMFTQMVVDQVLADGDQDLLTFLGGTFVLLLVMQVAVSAMRTWMVMWLSSHFTIGWTGNVFQHLMKLPYAYFLKRHLGDIVSRFGAINTIQQTLTTRFVEAILDGLMASVTLVMMFIYSRLLGCITAVAIAIYTGLRALYFRTYREANLGQVVLAAKQQSAFMEAARGVQTLRLYNQGAAQTARYLNTATDTLNCSIAIQKLNLLFGSFSTLVSGLQRIGVLWLGAWLALREQFSAGMLMAFLAYADQFSQRSSGLVDYLIDLRLLRLQGERLADIVLTPPEAFMDGSYSGPQVEPSVSFRNVSYRYGENEQPVLRDVSFRIQAGESVAIVGPSGCGKSTLVRIMLGLLDPGLGQVEIGGINLQSIGKSEFRRMTASVMQDDVLFAGSIAENISFFDQSATPERIEEVARRAEIHDEIAAMPMGYHTLVGDMGSSLSGGQKQRLLLARALYKNPKILVLDEATSHLDVPKERSIAQTLKSMAMTRVIIAHRPETIASADRVLAFMNGSLHEAVKHYPSPGATPFPAAVETASISQS